MPSRCGEANFHTSQPRSSLKLVGTTVPLSEPVSLEMYRSHSFNHPSIRSLARSPRTGQDEQSTRSRHSVWNGRCLCRRRLGPSYQRADTDEQLNCTETVGSTSIVTEVAPPVSTTEPVCMVFQESGYAPRRNHCREAPLNTIRSFTAVDEFGPLSYSSTSRNRRAEHFAMFIASRWPSNQSDTHAITCIRNLMS